MAIHSDKHLAIVKANAQVTAVVGIAAFVSVFSLVASQALWTQNSYLSKVANLKEKAHVQLEANLKASESLVDSYGKFTSSETNAIGGSRTGTGDNDGDNAKLVLNALPSSYDFPALTSSIEKILSDRNLKISSITGTDDEVAQKSVVASPTPQPIPMAFSFSINEANYSSVQELMQTLQLSIRPIQIDTLTLSGAASSMQVTVTAHTFFQPPKTINITSPVVQ